MTAPGVQSGETFFKAINLTREVGWREKYEVVSHQQIAAEGLRKWKQ